MAVYRHVTVVMLNFTRRDGNDVVISVLVACATPTSAGLRIARSILILRGYLASSAPKDKGEQRRNVLTTLQRAKKAINAREYQGMMAIVMIMRSATRREGRYVMDNFAINLIHALLSNVRFLRLIRVVKGVVAPYLDVMPYGAFNDGTDRCVRIILFDRDIRMDNYVHPIPIGPLLVTTNSFIRILFLRQVRVRLQGR